MINYKHLLVMNMMKVASAFTKMAYSVQTLFGHLHMQHPLSFCIWRHLLCNERRMGFFLAFMNNIPLATGSENQSRLLKLVSKLQLPIKKTLVEKCTQEMRKRQDLSFRRLERQESFGRRPTWQKQLVQELLCYSVQHR